MAKKTIKKQKAKKSTLRFLVFGVACIIISGTVALSISKLWSEIYQKYKEKKDLNQKLVELKSQEKELKVDVEKMQDPDFLGDTQLLIRPEMSFDPIEAYELVREKLIDKLLIK